MTDNCGGTTSVLPSEVETPVGKVWETVRGRMEVGCSKLEMGCSEGVDSTLLLSKVPLPYMSMGKTAMPSLSSA